MSKYKSPGISYREPPEFVGVPGAYYGSDGITDRHLSKDYLISKMMIKYGITYSDLDDLSIVKSKIRNIEISNILNEKNE